MQRVAMLFAFAVTAACDEGTEELDEIPGDEGEEEPLASDDELASQVDPAAFSDWRYVIREYLGAGVGSCDAGGIVTGFYCDDSYCGYLSIACDAAVTPGETTWLPWITDKAPKNMAWCPGDQFVTGFACSDLKCDKMSVECTSTGLPKTHCQWESEGSVEDGSWPAGYGLVAIQCPGQSCKTPALYVCSTW